MKIITLLHMHTYITYYAKKFYYSKNKSINKAYRVVFTICFQLYIIVRENYIIPLKCYKIHYKYGL